MLTIAIGLAACGGAGDQAGSATGSDGNATTATGGGLESGSDVDSDPGSGSGGSADTGSVKFKISGNWDEDGEFVFIPEASAYIDGYWSLSFAPNRDGSGDAVLSILLNEEALVFTYGDPTFTVSGGPDNCEFNIADQSINGASGSIECTNLFGLPAESSARDGVDFSATFDART